jgi:RNA-directed DNA polymerase
VVERCQQVVSAWLRPLGLTLQPTKTRITHTLTTHAGPPGCDCLGVQVRQYPVGKPPSGKDSRGRLRGCKTLMTPSHAARRRQRTTLRPTIARSHDAAQRTLIAALPPRRRGGSHSDRHGGSARGLRPLDATRYMPLRGWAISRHPHQATHRIRGKYWRMDEGKGGLVQPPTEGHALARPSGTPMRRPVQVQGTRSPYDGDWRYGSTRCGHHPTISPRVGRLLKAPQGRCRLCGLYFREDDALAVDHITPKAQGGSDTVFIA